MSIEVWIQFLGLLVAFARLLFAAFDTGPSLLFLKNLILGATVGRSDSLSGGFHISMMDQSSRVGAM
jgi:hypothetical protein